MLGGFDLGHLPAAPDHAAPQRRARRSAFLEGFSLHANTHLHEHDREGLERICVYGARGPLSLQRLTELPDGRLSYFMKRKGPNGKTHLVLTAAEPLGKLAALVPPAAREPHPLRGLVPLLRWLA